MDIVKKVLVEGSGGSDINIWTAFLSLIKNLINKNVFFDKLLRGTERSVPKIPC